MLIIFMNKLINIIILETISHSKKVNHLLGSFLVGFHIGYTFPKLLVPLYLLYFHLFRTS